jgi:hypothetical protein
MSSSTFNAFLFNDIIVFATGEKVLDTLPLEHLWMNTVGNSHFILSSPEKQLICNSSDYVIHLQWVQDLQKAIDQVTKGATSRTATYTFVDGSIYAGEWQAGPVPTGNGIWKKSNANGENVVYKGDLKEKRMEGIGTLKFASGDYYSGSFKDDFPHG